MVKHVYLREQPELMNSDHRGINVLPWGYSLNITEHHNGITNIFVGKHSACVHIKNGKIHRDDGPAVIYTDDQFKDSRIDDYNKAAFYLNGRMLSLQTYIAFSSMDKEAALLYKLKYEVIENGPTVTKKR